MSDMSLLSWADTYIVLTTAITIVIPATVFQQPSPALPGAASVFAFFAP